LKVLQFDKHIHQSLAFGEVSCTLQVGQWDWPWSHFSDHTAGQFKSGWRHPGRSFMAYSWMLESRQT